jgi:hypothetical protein
MGNFLQKLRTVRFKRMAFAEGFCCECTGLVLPRVSTGDDMIHKERAIDAENKAEHVEAVTKLIAERDEARAACAAMRAELAWAIGYLNTEAEMSGLKRGDNAAIDGHLDWLSRADAALVPDAGSEFLTSLEAAERKAALAEKTIQALAQYRCLMRTDMPWYTKFHACKEADAAIEAWAKGKSA